MNINNFNTMLMEALTRSSLTMSWDELEIAWLALSHPSYRGQVTDLITILRRLGATADPKPLSLAIVAITACLINASPKRTDKHFTMAWLDLSAVWTELAHPTKISEVNDTLDTLKSLALQYDQEGIGSSFVAMTTWLVDPEPSEPG
ncbi:hypothetical protein [Asticcacaulis sp. YBE204]|uniref:hypothetical protein n=1 Tax=Asticcacaulis sp. YBE204 TaxID=1282363 RepID=UPI001F44FD50|nr:hypothetical protein [Asticcacaulis sp. YBE204]